MCDEEEIEKLRVLLEFQCWGQTTPKKFADDENALNNKCLCTICHFKEYFKDNKIILL